MTETPVVFGPHSTLVGIITQPDGKPKRNLACLTFNAGVIHRIGPHRFNVKLVRNLAGMGILGLRFDIGGLGDSKPTGAENSFLQQAVADIRVAMDFVETQYGIREFILIGNCSGAVQAYWTAIEDKRVAGLLMFDGYTYATQWSRMVRHWKRFRSLGWGNAARAVSRRLTAIARASSHLKTTAAQDESAVPEIRTKPPRDVYCQQMESLVARNVKIFWVYSGGIIDYYSYANQYRAAFGRESFFTKIRYAFVPEIDHTLLSLDSQERLIGMTRQWLESEYQLA